MTTVTLEEAQAKLPELIEQLAAGEGLLITRNEQPIAAVDGRGEAPAKATQGRQLQGNAHHRGR